MTRIVACMLAFLTLSLSETIVSASDPDVIAWSDLVPGKVSEDPFEKLSDEQLQELSHVVRVRMLLAEKKLSPESKDVSEALTMEQSLRKQGIDIQWLLSQRDRVRQLRTMQANAVEPSLDGRRVTLAGYVIPVRSAKGRLTEFLLVPSIDACSHSIPPPPNQIIYVRLPDGIANVNRLKPVLITGLMKAQSTTSRLLRGNGPTSITAAYAISADTMTVFSAPK